MLRSVPRFASLALLVVTGAACGGKDGGTEPPTQSIDIALSVSELRVLCGSSGTATVTLTRTGGYTGTVTIALDGLPNDVTVNISPSQLSGTSTVATITVDASAALPGQYSILVTASSSVGEATDSYELRLVEPPDYSLNVSPPAITVNRGETGTATVLIDRVGGFVDGVTLALQNPPTGISASFSPVIATGSSASVTFSVAGIVAAGNYTLNITGTATGFSTRTASIDLTVEVLPDFTITAEPTALTIARGASANTTITVTREAGHTAPVLLELDDPPPGITGTFNPASVTGSTSTLTISVAPSVVAGTYPVLVVAEPWAVEHMAGLQITVIEPLDFSLTLNPPQLDFERPGSGNTQVLISRSGGFTGAVDLSLVNPPAGISATFNPASPTGGTSTMTVSALASVPAQAYTLTVRGAGLGVGHRDVTLALTLLEPPPPSITLALNPAALSIPQWQSGASNLVISFRNYSGNVTLSSSDAPAGMTVTFSPIIGGNNSTVTVAVDLSVPVGTYPVTIKGDGTGISTATAILQVTVTKAPGQEIEYQFCNPVGAPVFFAIQDGQGPWRVVTPTVNGSMIKFTFPFVNNHGGFAFITDVSSPFLQSSQVQSPRPGIFRSAFKAARVEARASRTAGRVAWAAAAGTTYETYLGLGTLAEFQRDGQEWCTTGGPRGTYTGTATGLVTGDNARVALGEEFANIPGAAGIQQFTIFDAYLGTKDLFASRRPGGGLVDRFVVLRDLVRPSGGALPLVDFNGANSGAALPATVNVGNTLGDFISDHLFFQTTNGNTGIFVAPSGWSLATTRQFQLVPPELQRAGDVMGLEVRTSKGLPDREDDIRRVTLGLSPNDNVVNVLFGPAATPPNVTSVATDPYLRLRFQGPVPTGYSDLLSVWLEPWNGGAQGGNFVAAGVTKGYLQAIGSPGNYDVSMPDLSGLPGFPMQSVLPRGEIYIDATAFSVTGGVNENPLQSLRIGMRVDRARWLRFMTF